MTNDAPACTNAQPPQIDFSQPLARVMAEVERLYLARALGAALGNQAEAARMAGVTAETMRKKLTRYDVRVTFHLT